MASSPHTDPASVYEGLILDGRYQLFEEIGRGSSGRVYRAKQIRVGRDVAVKILRKDLILDERMTARFEREARAVAMLDHPCCLTLHDFGYDADLGSLFMVTELLDGETLRAVAPRLPEMGRLQVGYDIADALKHAHAAGIIHRDLKPENVLVDFGDDGSIRVKVVDFGLALLFARGDTSGERRRLTMSGEIHGSPRYLSPEQCRGALSVTSAADMYALGVMLYELFDGDVPFPGPSLPALLTAHVSDAPPPMSKMPVIDVEQLIYELLEKDPSNRPTAHESRDVFARHVDLQRSGVFDPPHAHGLAEHTLDSDAFDDPAPRVAAGFSTNPETPAASLGEREPPETETRIPSSSSSKSGELEVLLKSREARIGAVLGSIITLSALLLFGLIWLLAR